MRAYRLGYAILAPRGVGPTRWGETSRFDGKPSGQHIRRRFLLLGQTLEGQQVWDVRRGIACLGTIEDGKKATLSLQASGEMAGIALYAGLFEPGVSSFDLWHPPSSHRRGPTLLNVLTVLDMPQAVALALPRRVSLHVAADEAKDWEWARQLAEGGRREGVSARHRGVKRGRGQTLEPIETPSRAAGCLPPPSRFVPRVRGFNY